MAFDAGAVTAKLILDDTQFRKGVQRASKATDQLEDGIEDVGDQAKETSIDLQGMVGTLKTLFVGGIIAAGVKSVIQLGAEMEQTRVSFTTLLKSAGKANQVIAELNEFANVTPFVNDQVVRAGKSLLAFGVASDDLTDSLKKIGDISAGTGKDFNELAVIFGKAKVAGTLFGEDINQLLEAGVPIIGELAKNLNVAEDQIKKMASQGKIRFADLEKAFTTLTEKGGLFAGMMKAQSETAAGLASTIQGKLQVQLIELGEIMLEAIKPILKFTIQIIDAFNALDDDTKKIILTAVALTIGLGALAAAIFGIITIAPTLGAALTIALGPVGIAIAVVTLAVIALSVAIIKLRNRTDELIASAKTQTKTMANLDKRLKEVEKSSLSAAEKQKEFDKIEKQLAKTEQQLGINIDKTNMSLEERIRITKRAAREQLVAQIQAVSIELGKQEAALKRAKELQQDINAPGQFQALATVVGNLRGEFLRLNAAIAAVDGTAADTSKKTKKAFSGIGREISDELEIQIVEEDTIRQDVDKIRDITIEQLNKGGLAGLFGAFGAKISGFLVDGMADGLKSEDPKIRKQFEDSMKRILMIANAAGQAIQDAIMAGFTIRENEIQAQMNRFELFSDVFMTRFSEMKQAEINEVERAENEKIAIERRASAERIAIFDEEFARRKALLEQELAAKLMNIDEELARRLMFIEENAAIQEQGVILENITEEDAMRQRERAQKEFDKAVQDALKESNANKAAEKKKADDNIVKLEADRDAKLEALREKKEAEEKAASKAAAFIRWQMELAQFKVGQSAARSQAMISFGNAIMSGIAGAMASAAATGPAAVVSAPAFIGIMSGFAAAGLATSLAAIASAPPPLPPAELFLQGGGLVPGQGFTDTVPARLTPGELVVDRATTDSLISNLRQGAGSGMTTIHIESLQGGVLLDENGAPIVTARDAAEALTPLVSEIQAREVSA